MFSLHLKSKDGRVTFIQVRADDSLFKFYWPLSIKVQYFKLHFVLLQCIQGCLRVFIVKYNPSSELAYKYKVLYILQLSLCLHHSAVPWEMEKEN